ncbi:MAG: DUF4169 family protein [Rhodospirillales bacterium]|nr:DUF4169 family protein [Rhodospirillales bacterium]
MAEIVNLRRVRRQLARAEAAKEAAGNRARHGRTASERAARDAEESAARATLDGRKLDRDPPAKD